MNAMLNFTAIVVTTMIAAAAAVAMDWLLLRVVFRFMRPATAGAAGQVRGAKLRVELAEGARELARAFTDLH